MRINLTLDFPETKNFKAIREQTLAVINSGKEAALVNCTIRDFQVLQEGKLYGLKEMDPPTYKDWK